jgi:hypothetical protein
MARNGTQVKHKHYILDEAKIKQAQKLLGTATETETIERALEEVISEHERNRRAWQATERLLKSGIQVKDVFGRVDGA